MLNQKSMTKIVYVSDFVLISTRNLASFYLEDKTSRISKEGTGGIYIRSTTLVTLPVKNGKGKERKKKRQARNQQHE